WEVPPNAVRARPLPLRGIAANGRGAELAYAIGRTRPVVEALEEYFAVPFPFEKLDLIAVPGMGGAMENAGAITFAEEDLMVDPAAASLAQKANVSETIAHEVAHQWFGDLVTMPWWDDLWLNEGFATWMASKVMDRVDPGQHVSLLLLGRIGEAMVLDARESS